MLKRIFSHSVLYAIGPQLPSIITLFLLPITTKYLTAFDYTVYGITLAYTSALNAFKDLGLQLNLMNYFFKAKENPAKWKLFWQKIFGILIIWSLPYAIMVFLILYFFVQKYIDTNFHYFVLLIILPFLLFDSVNTLGIRYYQSKQEPQYLFIVAVITGIIGVVTNYFLIVNLKLHYWSFFITNFVTALINFSFFLYPVFFKLKLYPVFKIKKNQMKNFFRVSLPMIPHKYSGYLLDASDRIILDLYKINPQQIGQYNFAYTLGKYADAVGNSVGQAVGPMYYTLFAKRQNASYQQAKYLTFFLQVVFLFFTFMASLWVREIFNLITSNAELAAAYPFAIVILMSNACMPMYWACVMRLGFEDKTKQLWRISSKGAIINVALNLLLIPNLGVMGSAIATFIGLLVVYFYGMFTVAFKELDTQKYYPHIWILLIITLGSAAFFLQDASILIKGVISVIVFFSTFAYFYFHKSQLKFLLNN